MNISMILALDGKNSLGYNGDLPWPKNQTDLVHFRKNTIGKPCVMGRKTFESLGSPLEKRLNIVLTKDIDSKLTGCAVVNNIKQVLDVAEKFGDELMVIGGSHIYKMFEPISDKVYLTRIKGEFDADVYYQLDESLWEEISRYPTNSADYIVYKRV